MRLALAAGAALLIAAPLAAQVPMSPPGAPSGPTAPTAGTSAGATGGGTVSAGPGDPRINQLIVYGDDPCPASTDDTITVCARRSEDDRYRVPENLRNSDDPESNSWTNKAIELSYVGRTGIQSCTPVGPGGASGCFQQFASQYRAERGSRDVVNWNRLIETARQERLGRIDEQAEEDERRASGE
jgi:hypothetical protein